MSDIQGIASIAQTATDASQRQTEQLVNWGLAAYDRAKAEQWNKQNQANYEESRDWNRNHAMKNMVEQLKKAGLNPLLATGMSPQMTSPIQVGSRSGGSLPGYSHGSNANLGATLASIDLMNAQSEAARAAGRNQDAQANATNELLPSQQQALSTKSELDTETANRLKTLVDQEKRVLESTEKLNNAQAALAAERVTNTFYDTVLKQTQEQHLGTLINAQRLAIDVVKYNLEVSKKTGQRTTDYNLIQQMAAAHGFKPGSAEYAKYASALMDKKWSVELNRIRQQTISGYADTAIDTANTVRSYLPGGTTATSGWSP